MTLFYQRSTVGRFTNKTLAMNIRKQFSLLRATIELSTEAEEMLLKTPDEIFNLYVCELPNDDNESLFLAFGTLRTRVLVQLLAQSDKEAYRFLLAPEIQQLLVDRKLPKIFYTENIMCLLQTLEAEQTFGCLDATLAFSKIQRYCYSVPVFEAYLRYILGFGRVIHLGHLALLHLMGISQNLNLILWRKMEDYTWVQSIKNHPDYPYRHLCYIEKEQRYILLHNTPGIIRAKAFSCSDLQDLHKDRSTQMSSSFVAHSSSSGASATGGVRARSKFQINCFKSKCRYWITMANLSGW